MKISWGWKIGILYVGFMGLIVTMVVASNRQHCDLVSEDYYGEEIAYQKVIDAGKNQAKLSRPLAVHATGKEVVIDFPEEFRDKVLNGDVKFYSPVDATWDRSFKISTTNNTFSVLRSALKDTKYTVKISCVVDGKTYYQESEIMLHA